MRAGEEGGVERVEAIRRGTIAGEVERVLPAITEALGEGVAPGVLLAEGLIAAMDEVGRRFEAGDCYIPEMLRSAKVMKSALETLRPHLVSANVEPLGRVVIGTMQGDLHDIGKNLVAIMLEGAGFEVVDLGNNVPAARFVEAVDKHRPGFVGFSAMLTTTMPAMAGTLEALAAAGLRAGVRVIVGGAPVTGKFAGEIGADLYAPTGTDAAHVLRRLAAADSRR
jgi:5-methyltetrahydrofolate--homocysteine methyltransferase